MDEPQFELLQSGKASFKIEIPYKLIETGGSGADKPLIVYLHGFKQTAESFRDDCKDLLKVHAYHLFIQAPYPVYDRSRSKPVAEWGRAWYLYDGDQDQFLHSLDHASRFIGRIIERTSNAIHPTRTALIGYSMGGYLAGYHAIKRPEQVNELIICAARFKSELLNGDYKKIFHLNVLALHGNADKSVESSPQEIEIEGLRERGMDATFVAIDGAHMFSQSYTEKILAWLNDKGYTCNSM